MTQDMNHTFVKTLRTVLVTMLTLLTSGNGLAQVKVSGNVYGGGNEASVGGSCTVVINVNPPTDGNNVTGDVYGGGALANTNASEYIVKTGLTVGTSDVTGLYERSGAGTNESPYVYTATEDATAQNGKTYYEKTSTTVTLAKGKVNGSVYGGGLGDAGHAANVNGAVTVNVSGGTATNVFGCNNVNGAPQSTVVVNIEKTGSSMTVSNVYGGGNQAAYTGNPVVNVLNGTVGQNVYGGGLGATAVVTGNPQVTVGDANNLNDDNIVAVVIGDVYGGGDAAAVSGTPVVNVIKCNSSIANVYGGGNAANVSATSVTIDGGTIDMVFGGGHGDKTSNPQKEANVTGDVSVNVTGGTITKVFGGSNSKGTIGGTVSVNVNKEATSCGLYIAELYGGGNEAAGNAGEITIGCTGDLVDGTDGHIAHPEKIGTTLEGIGAVYGGANAADVSNSITLNITGGIIENVFGGNNTSSNIFGNITVNIEKGSGTCGWYVGNVYGGGNLAAYHPTTAGNYPEVNIKNGTVSGNVYGGGLGATAKVYSNPKVTVGDVTEGHEAYVATVNRGVYGGGSAAMVGDDVTTTASTYNTTVLVQKANSSVSEVFGGGAEAGVTGSTTVTIENGRVSTGVYGGCDESGTIGGNITVALNGGTIGTESNRAEGVFGGGYGSGTATNGGVTVTINGSTIYGDVYGGSALGSVNDAAADATAVTLTTGTVYGNLFGGGLGEAGETNVAKGQVNGAVTVTVNGGSINSYTVGENTYGGNVFGANNTNGSPKSSVTVYINNDVSGNIYGGGNLAAYSPTTADAYPAVYINNGTVSSNVYGGGLGSTAIVTSNPVVTIGDNTDDNNCAIVFGDVYGGGDAAAVTGSTTVIYNDNNTSSTVGRLFGGGNAAGVSGTSSVTLTNGKVTGGVYGGCNTSGNVAGNITVGITAGTIGTSNSARGNVHGGGLGSATTTEGTVTVNIAQENASAGPTIYGDIYGGSGLGQVSANGKLTQVNFYKGTINGDIYGGGLGDNEHAAEVSGNVAVNIYGGVFNKADGTVGGGSIFGCNNANGTPKGNVAVNIYATDHGSTVATNAYPSTTPEGGWNATNLADNAATQTYAIAAVYGGGNQAAYLPTAASSTATVHIYNCDNTIQSVFGGGNAANVGTDEIRASTAVIIEGGRINRVFGGGNGVGTTNGANIYGTASTTLYAGLIDQVFGGSNEKGNVNSINLVLGSSATCSKFYGEVFGGGNMAGITGDLTTTIQCGAGYLGDFYGGANAASINGNVTLNIYGGTYDNVFGGSKGDLASLGAGHVNTEANISGNVTLNLYGGTITNAFGGSDVNGNIGGVITVNVLDLEDQDCPLQVENIYGAGNLTAYTPNDVTIESVVQKPTSPVINVMHVKNGSSITGSVYGGAKGNADHPATVTANPKVTIGYDSSMSDQLPDGYTIPTSTYAKVDGSVFGGGDLSPVVGTTSVTIQTANSSVPQLFGGGNRANVGGATVNVDGGSVSTGVYGGCNTSGTVTGAVNVYVNGGNIGSSETHAYGVFGGGKGSETATGDAVTVTIGNANGTTPTIYSDVYGGSAEGTVNAGTSNLTKVWLKKGDVYGDIYGGGFGDNSANALVNGNVQVVVDGGTLHAINTTTGGRVFGANNAKGTPLGSVTVDINNNVSGNVYGGGNLAAYSPTNAGSYPAVNINNGTVGNVFGGGLGATAKVYSNPTVTVGDVTEGHENYAATVTGGVYGGGSAAMVGNDEDNTAPKNNTTVLIQKANSSVAEVFGGGALAGVTGTTTVTIANGAVSTGVYGGCDESGTVGGAVAVSVTGGTIGTDATHLANVHGGGYGKDTSTGAGVTVTIGDGTSTPVIWGDVYGGSALGNVNNAVSDLTKVWLKSGTINGSLYGGGLGDNTNSALVQGKVEVVVDGGNVNTTTNTTRTTGAVFGCNNVNGTPKGTVEVTINSTAASSGSGSSKVYALQGVYGGGNLAHYDPTTPGNYPTVTVNGCTTSIKDVFGGGNAAAVPYTSVTINGGDIDRVFAGGNGASGTAANVGYKNSAATPTAGTDEYGTGTTNAEIKGGTINEIYGGSNSKGTVRATGALSIAKPTSGENLCDMKIGSVYGGGNQAPGAAVALSIGCTGTGDDEGITNVFGGANAANVTSNILLNITEGKIANVFGGNNSSGSISGTITVNINKAANPCVWNVGNVFGGGKDAAYSTSSIPEGLAGLEYSDATAANYYKNFPKVNIKNGTVSNVFGGGQGSGAAVTGNPQVTIGDATNANAVAVVTHDVYGGGDAAAVVGTPVVHVINKSNTSIGNVYGGGNAADVSATNVTIDGGTITGDVYGGGHGDKASLGGEHTDKVANVNGNVAVSVTGGTINRVFAGSNTNGSITGTVGVTVEKDASSGELHITELYGGGNMADGNAGNITIGCTGAEGEGIGDVYGGANQANIGTSTTASNISLNITGGSINRVFGGNNTSGTIYGTIQVDVNWKTGDEACGYNYLGSVFGGGNLATYTGSPIVNIKNGTVSGSVYGGGKGGSAVVTGNPIVTIGDAVAAHSAIVNGNVYGGGDAAAVTGNTTVTYNDNNAASTVGKLFGGGNAAGVSGNATVNMNAGKLTGSVYGGCNASGTIGGSSTVTVTGGIVGEGTLTPSYTLTTKGNVFGGGYGKDTYVAGNVEVNIGTSSAGNAVIFGDVYGGGALGHVNAEKPTGSTPIPYTSGKTTTVNLNNGTIFGDAYGGGLGQKTGFNGATVNHAAFVGGDVVVNVNGAAFIIDYENTNDKDPKDNTKWIQALTSGRVFGCNNLNGYPLGDVTVTVNKTVKGNVERSSTASKTNDNATYEIAAVYGGGNLADYTPTKTGAKPYVIINDCDVSIKQVYGGGNAAEVPGTDVDVRGAYEIHQVFGGGNGADKYKDDNDWQPNPGANVNGSPNTLLKGGVIHEAYGGSNEKGITGTISIKMVDGGLASCPLDLGKMVVAGKNADTFGDVKAVMDCNPSSKTPLIYFGADNANVWGNVEMTITSGNFGKVFAGNNLGGAIFGHVILNIEETGNCPTPITIDELYLGGNQASYSIYGYYREQTGTDGDNNPIYVYKPRTSATDAREPYYLIDKDTKTVGVYSNIADFPGYAEPVLNVISATRIDEVFGGGYGEGGDMYANPTVNINMVPGSHAATAITRTALNGVAKNHRLGTIGNVYGGGNAAVVYGNTTVNIGTESKVYMVTEPVHLRANSSTPMTPVASGVNKDLYEVSTEGAYITGNVYGGGKLADVTGNTFVNICAKKSGDDYVSVGISDDNYEGVTIGENGVNDANHGNVFGGGKGLADNFLCDKAMVGEDGKGVDSDFNDDLNYLNGNTSVIIGNGTINGNVYGGGEIGRVEKNTTVTIGIGDGDANKTSAPIIRGDVFGGGKGDKEHGYAALVRGNPTVIVQGDAKVGHSVYGAGEIASVARYRVPKDENEVNAAIAAGYKDAKLGMPYALANTTTHRSGYCTVKVQGNAEIGPDGMQMTKAGGPDDAGHVFAAGKGFLPEGNWGYNENDKTSMPKRMVLYDAAKFTDANQKFWEYVDPTDANNKNVWEYFPNRAKYIEFIQTQALASNTEVTIGDDNGATPFIKGSVYGGSENGLVQFDTKVYIKGGQIGVGKNTTERHPDAVWADNYDPSTGPDLECASWEYKAPYAPYDPYAKHKNATDGKYYYDDTYTKSAEGGAIIATDGHTYYGNVFGGGSGSVPYFDTTEGNSKYLNTAGTVKGKTYVEISGGHILTNVYGGCEATNVLGKATVKMSGGTIGVPRTLQQIIDHPVTCYLFGGGKGDQRIFFNKDTNVEDAEVQVSGGRIYGSVFGGGEDGHVMRDVTMTIGEDDHTGPTIGTWGTSYVDGNIFGGGRGFGGDAYTAGNVAGSVDVDIKGGSILGSVYGGGRMASVGYGLYMSTEDGYGQIREDGKKDDGTDGTAFFTNGRGHVDITISGGTIGNDIEYKYNPTAEELAKMPFTEFDTDGRLKHTKGGNVFAGGMGRLYQLDGTTPITVIDWWKLGCVKSTKLTITGGNIKSNVYGGGELGQVVGHHATQNAANEAINTGTEIIIQGSNTTIGTEIKDGSNNTLYTFGSVFGGGYGSLVDAIGSSKPKFIAGLVKEDTKIDMQNGAVKACIYGGGEMASVGESTTSGETTTVTGSTYVSVSNGTVGIAPIEVSGTMHYFGGAKMGNVYGGGSGHGNTVRSGLIFKNTNVTIKGGTIYHNVYGGGAYGTVGEFNYTEDPNENNKVIGVNSLKTSGTGVATVTITGGTIGYDGKENGMIFGSSRGDVNAPGKRDDHTAWVYDANVTIGTSGGDTSTPLIKGSVYGSGENGHTFHDTDVKVHSGTIGIADDAEYPYRGNVYGGGCGTDKYYSTGTELFDGNGDSYNPLAGVVYGNATVTIDGGQVVRNVYGAGAMGSVGKTVTTGDVSKTTGGLATISISGGQIGVDGTAGDGNVFGAARGDAEATSNEFALVRKETSVSVTGGNVMGNVYGGGELGCVGTYIMSSDMRTFTWQDTDGSNNTAGNSKNTGLCNVTINGSSAVVKGNVFGAGKGKDDTFWCEKGIAYSTDVSVINGTVNGNVYGGGEVGRVETDAEVKIGIAQGEGKSEPTINGSVFGGGAGVETHGYSALVRGNTTVTIDQYAHVGHSVYGGGEVASVGKYGLDDQKMPSILQGGGYCYVTVKGNAAIADDVYGAGKGVTPHFDKDNTDPSKRSRRMTLKNDWESLAGDARFDWDYFQTESDYSTYLETLALATHPEVTIDESANISGSVFGGGELGLTKGSVIVTIKGGTIAEDVYGGGSLANTNTTSTVDLDGDGVTETVHPTTTVKLLGGLIEGDAYGGGLGDLAARGTGHSDIAALVYGDVNVTLDGTRFNISYLTDNSVEGKSAKVVNSGRVFGCNNLNGSPKGNVTVTVNKTVAGNVTRTPEYNSTGRPPMGEASPSNRSYELAAVYGGGNLADYVAEGTGRKTNVIITTCDVSIEEVYGGGNAAKVPETNVLVNGAYEIEHVFGGGNGKDNYTLDGGTTWNTNPGADIDGNTNTLIRGGYVHEAYGASNEKGTITGSVTIDTGTGGDCQVQVDKLVAAGKNADVNGDLIVILGCKDATKIPIVYGGADNANVNGNVELTITSGHFGQVFGGNNLGGAIRGHIILNIEETSDCEPIRIDELYLGGNQAAYSRFGYYVKTVETEAGSGIGAYGETAVLTSDENKKLIFVPRTSATDSHLPVNTYGKDDQDKWTWTTTAIDAFTPYDQPVLNLISCTEVGKVFGGGYGKGGDMYADPTVNINMIPGKHAAAKLGGDHKLGVVGNVYGGGNEAVVIGNATINIGTEKTVTVKSMNYNAGTNTYTAGTADVEGANITGNVYGGGNKADIIGDTHVNICAKEVTNSETNTTSWQSVTYGTGLAGVSIDKKANGTDDSGGSVFGGGCSADVLGNTFVRVSGGYVFNGVFGGGYAGSVGKFTRSKEAADTDIFGHTAHEGECIGKPVSCEAGTGKCTVVVDGGQIGPITVATLGMNRPKAQGGPVPQGWVWGGGQGIIEDPEKHPDTHFKSYVGSTDVTIGGTAFIMESIIGGGEFGRVLGNTLVKIQDHCQIGVGEGMVDANNKPIRYTEAQFIDPTTTEVTTSNALKECSHFDYGFDHDGDGKLDYLPYDPYYEDYPDYVAAHPDFSPASTSHPSDGKTWIGCVFAGGSGYMPYKKEDGTGYDWCSSAGWVEGNAEVQISGGHILTNVYGGNEYTNVKGKSIVTMTGGTIGVPRTVEQIQKNPLICYLFGAGRGDQRTHFNKETNVGDVEVKVTGGIIYGSVFGGGEDGHVLKDVTMTIGDNAKIGTWGTSYVDGNVFGGGRGFSGEAQTAGTVGGNVTLNISGGKMLGSVYGGGRLASVGTQFTAPNDNNYGNFVEDGNGKTYGHVTVNISGGTIGNEKATGDGAKYSGNVFGGSMGRLDLLDGTRNLLWPKMAQVKNTTVNIYDNANIIRSVFGGGELGTVRDNAYVTIGGYKTADPDADGNIAVTKSGSPTVRRDVYGGGYGSEDRNYTIFTVNELENDKQYHPHTYAFTPMQFAGCVGQNTYVNVVGGYIRKSVYGGGELASVGVINYRAEKLNGASTSGKVVIHDKESGEDFFYSNMVKHEDVTKEFALSWPYEFNYVSGYEGATHVKVTGGRLGLKDGDTDTGFEDNGDVYGAGKGQAGDYKDFVFCANVGSTNVVIDHSDSNGLQEYSGTANLIAGAVYGGGEDGHVMGDTKLTMTKGFVYHSIYGGGSGKGTFTKWLTEIPEDRRTVVSGDTGSGGPETRVNEESHTKEYKATCYSITAGKVFGNTEVEMTGGTVVRNVYGGGNMASVGKGNYSGGPDDYSTSGYGETLPEGTNLWDGNNKYSQAFLNSGRCTVNITGGKVGYIGYDPKDPLKFVYPRDLNTGLPYGNVFGGCRGEAAPNILETPRYLYSPEFFLGYVNETIVNIGIADKPASGTVEGGDYVAATPASGPTIAGSVYGGGMDGHVRRDTKVTINGGVIGSEYTTEECSKVGTSDLNDIMWLHRGNVYGAGSGTGKYKFDLNYDGDYGDEIDYTTPSTQNSSGRATRLKEEDHSTSAGSVTRFTEVTINGGTIHRNVYGGGSLSSIGGPRIPPITSDPARKGDTSVGEGIQSLNKVTITNGTIGDAKSYAAGYGGYVFGASRGDATLDNPSSFAQSVWTDVNVKGGTIMGDVYGGGEVGSVRQSTEVTLKGGTIMHDAYGGGKGTANVEANVGGETLVKLNEGVGEDEKGCVVSRLFGGNNVNGTPGGKTQVYVYATQNKDKTDIKTKNAKHDGLEAEDATTTTYDVKAVYGGGNLSPYIPAGADGCAEVYIQGCDLTSIKQVYGGANSASTPATKVTVNSAYEIQDLFGGGDGQGSEFGANVGYLAYPASYDPPASSKEERTEKFGYGSGVASLNIYGGRIHRVFGGSNTKGNVRETAITMLDNQDPCELEVDEVYGGGKSAPMDAEAILHMACIPGLKVAYGGAQEADVLNNVVLNITNGTYDRIFGGNNISGTIKGSITVNIEETGCKPLIIGELYGGGNLAGYSVYGYNDDKSLKESGTRLYADPQINVKSFTSIGNIYGGGLGESAVMVGNPTVNINVVKGDYVNYVGDPTKYGDGYEYDDNGYKGTMKTFDGYDVTIPSHEKGKIGAIQNVFGGGNAAKVVGNTSVNVGTQSTVTLETKEDDTTTTDVDEKHPTVIGADIRGNVYGGGNNAEVTGNTDVVIGKKKTE